jgi:type III secretory pathway component EscT
VPTLEGLVLEVAPWARAFARVLPTATLVPALAIRGAPAPLRGAIAIALSAPIAAAFPWSGTGSLAIQLLADAIAGIPLAIAIATPLWMATHVGAIADLMRGQPEANVAPPPATEGARGPLGMLAGLLAASAWIASGGVARALVLLQRVTPERPGVAAYALAARALTDGLRLSIALAAGVLIAAVALEAAILAIGRAASPIPVQPIAMLARPIVAVLALALSIEVAVMTLVR